MALKNTFSCLWTLSLCLIASKPAKVLSNYHKVLSIKDPHFIKEWVHQHNDWRGKVNPPAANMKYLTWDKDLARLAKSWANECKLTKNPCTEKRYACNVAFDFIGENMFVGGLEHSPEYIISYWYNESKNYNFPNLSCSSFCNHYIQMVWATSYKLGCAITNCPSLGEESTGLFICNYGPRGNDTNTHPYIAGKPCSLCFEEKECLNNVCYRLTGRAPQHTAYHPLALGFILQRIFCYFYAE